MNIKELEESKYLYCIKAFAILCVVSAHASLIPKGSSILNQICSRLLDCLGTMGVPIFFIVSGYLFVYTKKTFREFWSARLKSLIMPWLFCETVLWFYVVLRKGGISFLAWFKFVVGIEHTTYYLTMLIIFYLVFWEIRKYKYASYVCIIMSIISVLSTGYHFGFDFINKITFTYYLNPFNWMGYFCIGMLMRKKTNILSVGKKCRKALYFMLLLLIVSISLHIYYNLPYTYFSKFSIINTILSTGIIFALPMIFRKMPRFLIEIGKYSFSIYLLHQLVVGVVVWGSSRVDIFIFTLLRPLITIGIVMIGIVILNFLNRLLNNKLNFVYKLIGAR